MINSRLWAFIIGVFLTYALAISAQGEKQSVVIKTKLGSYRGYVRESLTNKSVKEFLGIPFAEPPVGNNRFKPPLPVKPHDVTFDAKEQGPACVQKRMPLLSVNPFIKYYFGLGSKKPSEDCLFLNVYVPKNDNGTKLPVMVWIYGGAFVLGSTNSEVYDGITLAGEENIIVVTINYRMGSLGFLYLGIDEAPGNVGLMDQAAALQWIQDHISSFGGDPKRVTLFGESAGAASVGHHVLLESSRPLFKRAILQSGVAHMTNGIESREFLLDAASELAVNVGCPFDANDLSPTVKCFKSKDALELVESQPVHGYAYDMFFKPVTDGKYIKEHPELTIRKGLNFSDFSIISGNNEDEASMFLSAFYLLVFSFNDNLKLNEEDVRNVMREMFSLTNDSLILDLINTLYNDNHEPDLQKRLIKKAIRVGSDAAFLCAAAQFEKAMVDSKNTVYKYRFNHRENGLPLPKWLGVYHTAELGYVFGEPLDQNKTFQAVSRLLSGRIMRYWANFARTGDPNVSPSHATQIGEEDLPIWQPMNRREGNYLILDSRSTSNGFHNNMKCKFWTDIFPEIYKGEGQKKLPGIPKVVNLDTTRFYN